MQVLTLKVSLSLFLSARERKRSFRGEVSNSAIAIPKQAKRGQTKEQLASKEFELVSKETEQAWKEKEVALQGSELQKKQEELVLQAGELAKARTEVGEATQKIGDMEKAATDMRAALDRAERVRRYLMTAGVREIMEIYKRIM